jgi:hypothetical protein
MDSPDFSKITIENILRKRKVLMTTINGTDYDKLKEQYDFLYHSYTINEVLGNLSFRTLRAMYNDISEKPNMSNYVKDLGFFIKYRLAMDAQEELVVINRYLRDAKIQIE